MKLRAYVEIEFDVKDFRQAAHAEELLDDRLGQLSKELGGSHTFEIRERRDQKAKKASGKKATAKKPDPA